MAVKLIAPARNQALTGRNGKATLRVQKFFESIPDLLSPVADVGALVAPTANETILQNKINELLASLRDAGVLTV